MNTQQIDIESLLNWSAPKRVQTRNGPRDLLKAEPTEEFWNLWRSDKAQLKSAGLSVGTAYQEPDKWEVLWWRPPPKDEMERLQKNIALSQLASSDITIPKPDNGMDYFPFQKAGVAYSRGKDGLIIGDAMGLGKTIQAIGIINDRPKIRSGLVICPASVKRNWIREFQAWLARPLDVAIASSKNWPGLADVIILNYDILGKHAENLASRHWDIVIADECHMLRNTKTQRWKAFSKIECDVKVGLTGTPLLNKLEDIFTVLHWIAPDQFRTLPSFRYKFVDDPEGGNRLQVRLRESFMVRRLKSDVLKELPAKQRQVIEVDDTVGAVDAEAEALGMAGMNEELIANLTAALEIARISDNEDEYHAVLSALQDAESIPFESIARVRHETALRKVPLTIEHLNSCLESGVEKIVVFAHHRDCIEALAGRFPGSAILYGGMSEKQKDESIQRFMNDKSCQVWLGSIRAAGMGINGLQTVCQHGVFHELDWVPAMISQAEDRLHRIGQQDSVLIQHLVIAGSLDANMAVKCVAKQRMADEALDKDRDKLLAEQVLPDRSKCKTVNVSLTAREMEVESIDPGQKAAAHAGLQVLAGMCDGARSWDDHGFNKVDAHIGKRLAFLSGLTDRQGMLAKKLCRKYRRQLDPVLLERMGIKLKEDQS